MQHQRAHNGLFVFFLSSAKDEVSEFILKLENEGIDNY